MESLKISIKGVVQGVGFRPFVYNLACESAVKGIITNTTDGVVIIAEGENHASFIERIRTEAPPLARIVSIETAPEHYVGFQDFSIRESSDEGRFTLIAPDVSICGDCLRELFDSKDRRFLYPFINCTNCGPRYSITKKVPYDRLHTTMAEFGMCEVCSSEYHNPGDRRFHAQPNACHRCGPQLALIIPGHEGESAIYEDPVGKTQDLLRQGKIIAIKGIGGFHLACDATDRNAVVRLRERKRRNNKPFAVMAPDIDTIRRYSYLTNDEENVLRSWKRPVVLLRKLDGASLPEEIAPGNRHIGFMLPYTPVHYLLFRDPAGPAGGIETPLFPALVMTSGNVSEEPIIGNNEDALEKLASLADAFLVHNRDIYMRVDDAVVKVRRRTPVSQDAPSGPGLFFIRRSRGYVPEPILLDGEGPDVLGCGADLKNTFTITKGRYAIPSQHIGDMENYETLRFFEDTLTNLKSVYRAEPEAIAYDLHPHYMTTRWALDRGAANGAGADRTIGIQHHYAHVASVMAENSIQDRVIGVSFDGNGYGDDGSLWGGEFFLADIRGYTRAGHLRYVPLPGGDMAAREPWRMAVSYLREAAGSAIWDYLAAAGLIERHGRDSLERIVTLCPQRAFSPLSTAAGRLFDAVSALTGVCDRNTFEGEAAMAIESLATEGLYDDYPVDISFKDQVEVDFSPTVLSIVADLERCTDTRVISTKFHNTVAAAIVRVVLKLSLVTNVRTVIISGGVFQNGYLLARVLDMLGSEGLSVHTNVMVPCNDAGISLGQAYLVRERIRAGA